VFVGHFVSVRLEPGDVIEVGAPDGFPFEPMFTGEDRVAFAELDKFACEVDEILVGGIPVEPGDVVVLAVGVVIAFLGVSYFIPGEEHGYSL